jgi:hypothetical protein
MVRAGANCCNYLNFQSSVYGAANSFKHRVEQE